MRSSCSSFVCMRKGFTLVSRVSLLRTPMHVARAASACRTRCPPPQQGQALLAKIVRTVVMPSAPRRRSLRLQALPADEAAELPGQQAAAAPTAGAAPKRRKARFVVCWFLCSASAACVRNTRSTAWLDPHVSIGQFALLFKAALHAPAHLTPRVARLYMRAFAYVYGRADNRRRQGRYRQAGRDAAENVRAGPVGQGLLLRSGSR